MDKALDCNTKELISANKAEYTGSYICQYCGEAVYPKALESYHITKAHFSHYDSQHQKTCPGFHPSEQEHYALGSYKKSHYRKPSVYQSNRKLNFYLHIGEEDKKAKLCLYFPQAQAEQQWTGHIQCQARYGIKQLKHSLLSSAAQQIQVLPQKQDYQPYVVDGSIDEKYWSKLSNSDLSGFDESKIHLFKDSPFGGKRIKPHKHLYWNTSYLFLLHKNTNDVRLKLSILNIDVENICLLKDWQVGRLQLPEEQTVEQSLSRLLEHEIYPTPAKLSLLSPYPVEIDNETQEWIFTPPLKSLYIKLDKSAIITVISDNDERSIFLSAGCHNLENLPTEKFNLFVDKVWQFSITIEKKPVFQPQGIRILWQEQEIELFAAQMLFEQWRENGCEQQQIEWLFPCPTAESLLQDYSDWDTLKQILSDKNKEFILSAKNFGYIYLSAPTFQAKTVKLSQSMYQRLCWLLSLATTATTGYVTFPAGLHKHTELDTLYGKYWHPRFIAHLQQFFYELKEQGF